ncbi:MAG: hypothetical protein HAW60_02705 [Bdellovibrionales bacterium]|nr:hypothetical protein [Bdellovibrionales bacterium]
MKKFVFVSIILSFINVSSAIDENNNLDKAGGRFLLKQECGSNRDLVVANYKNNQKYEIKCKDNYSLYNSKSANKFYNKKKAIDGKKIKILNFNLLYPGQSNTRYKNYKLIANIINRYDIISGLELLGSTGSDNKINYNVLQEISKLKSLKNRVDISAHISKDPNALESLKIGRSLVEQKILKLMAVYKKPGYLKLFEELKKLDPSWSLIISTNNKIEKSGGVQELVGFYFKAKKVKLFSNQYCKEVYGRSSGIPYACTPKFSKDFFGIDAKFVFSRLPFMANFESGNFDFTIIASHVAFRTPKKTETVNKILKTAFGVNNIAELKGTGIRIDTYSRFAEIKLTMDLIKKMTKSYSEKDIIFAGDFNVESQNKFWKNPLMSKGVDLKLLVNEKTTLAKKTRLNSGGSIIDDGYSKNYDHFMINPKITSECDTKSAGRVDFINDENIKKIIDIDYIIRNKTLVAGLLYSIHKNAKDIISKRTAELKADLRKEKKILYSQIVPRYTQEEEDLIIFNYHRRVFESQMNSATYYRVYAELISDHAPIEISCSTNREDDDQKK